MLTGRLISIVRSDGQTGAGKAVSNVTHTSGGAEQSERPGTPMSSGHATRPKGARSGRPSVSSDLPVNGGYKKLSGSTATPFCMIMK
jgi:hypothetical protein